MIDPGFREFGRPCAITTHPESLPDLRVCAVENFEATRARHFPTWQGPVHVVEEDMWLTPLAPTYTVVGWRDDIPVEACS
jgi:hypothetical protein